MISYDIERKREQRQKKKIKKKEKKNRAQRRVMILKMYLPGLHVKKIIKHFCLFVTTGVLGDKRVYE